ncbi:MAG: hypothetical protein WCS77_10740, partial [Elusimicrobiaceae bacterium]
MTTHLNSKGLTLVMNLFVIAVFAILGTVVYSIAHSQIREVLYTERLAQSYYIAEAGLEDAMYEVYKNPSWRAGFNKKTFSDGYYTVTLSTESPPYITSTGYSPYIAFLGRVSSTVGARAAIFYANTADVYAIMAQTSVKITGPAAVNAYDPDTNLNPSSFNFGAGIWSNGSVTTTGRAAVNGNVYYANTASISANTVFGTVTKSTYTQTLPNHSCGGCKSKNDNQTGISGPASCYNSGTKMLTVESG